MVQWLDTPTNDRSKMTTSTTALKGRAPWIAPARALVEETGVTILPHLPPPGLAGVSYPTGGIALRHPVTSAKTFVTLVHELGHAALHTYDNPTWRERNALGRCEGMNREQIIARDRQEKFQCEVECWEWTLAWIEEHATELPASAMRVATQDAMDSLWHQVHLDMNEGDTEFPALAGTRWADLPEREALFREHMARHEVAA